MYSKTGQRLKRRSRYNGANRQDILFKNRHLTKPTRQTIVGGVDSIAEAEMQKIENFDELEDLTATTMRLRDVLDDICTQPIPTREAAVAIGLRLQLLASAIEDRGQELITGVFVLPN